MGEIEVRSFLDETQRDELARDRQSQAAKARAAERELARARRRLEYGERRARPARVAEGRPQTSEREITLQRFAATVCEQVTMERNWSGAPRGLPARGIRLYAIATRGLRIDASQLGSANWGAWVAAACAAQMRAFA